MIIYRLNGQVTFVDNSREIREAQQEDAILHAPNPDCAFDVAAWFRSLKKK